MDLLEHPLEAVAFRLYSLPIPEAASAATGAAAAWTCLAAVLAAAAAAGIWRLRSSTTSAAVSVSTKPPLELLDPSRTAEVSSPEPSSRPSSQRSPQPAAVSPSTPKERYTAYYRDAGCCVGCCDVGGDEDEEDEEEDDCDVAEEHEDRDVLVSDGADPFGWEVVVRSPSPLPLSPTAVSDMGRTRRYRMRSPTVTTLGGGGSVVQLWDQVAGGLTPTSSPRRRGRGVVVGAVSAF